jgi:hypothetical protein
LLTPTHPVFIVARDGDWDRRNNELTGSLFNSWKSERIHGTRDRATRSRRSRVRIPFIYARAFLYVLDAFDKFLGVLAKEEKVLADVATHHAKIADAFPHLRGVRNTAQTLKIVPGV